MKRFIPRSLALFLLAVATVVGAEPPAPKQVKYRMELVPVFDVIPLTYNFVVLTPENHPFVIASTASLKKFVATLPRQSTLEWAPGCCRRGGEPLLSSAQQMEDFKAFCREKGVQFVLVPSG